MNETPVQTYEVPSGRPLASRAHILFVLFFGASVVAALWQHGHAMLTFVLLGGMVPLAALAYVPYRFLPDLMRTFLHILIGMVGLFWLLLRIANSVPLDKALVESLAIFGSIFLGGERREDYGYLLIVSMFLLIYGALLPRSIFLWAYMGGLLTLPLLLYLDRTRVFSGYAAVGRAPRRRWYINAAGLVLLLVVAGSLFYWVFGLFPTRQSEREGIFEVSFQTENESMVPPEMRRWITAEVKTGEKTDPSAPVARSGNKPVEIDRKAATRVSGDAKDAESSKQGSGAAQGKDLVFCVKSPVKLYHGMQVYDAYDGEKWTTSPMMKRLRTRASAALSEQGKIYHLEQKYVITKWISSRLPSAYLLLSLDTFRGTNRICRVNYDGGGAFLMEPEKETAVPFTYYTSVQMCKPSEDADTYADTPGKPPVARKPPRKNTPPPTVAAYHRPAGKVGKTSYWLENVSRSHYLKLPAKRIPIRVFDLAYSLTWQKPRPYDKAIALRDYLRDTYPYKLHAAKLPAGKEGADYFLFELREGHCEYFALALAVMARSIGLPSRVVTGFSPGNFNSMTNQFEVYEYHGHAWTQIFIDGMGWVTVDATPPSAVESRTTPLGIGRLRDPFGDEWRVTPPELTSGTLAELERDRQEKLQKQKRDETPSSLEKTVIKVAEKEEQLREKLKKTYQKVQPKKQKENLRTRSRRLWDNFRDSLEQGFVRFVAWMVRHRWSFFALALAVGGSCYGAKKAWAIFICRRRMRKMNELDEQAYASLRTDPACSVRSSYQAARLLLLLADMPRLHNMELFDYAEAAAAYYPGTAEALRELFSLYYDLEYGRHADGERAARAYEAFKNLRKELEEQQPTGI